MQDLSSKLSKYEILENVGAAHGANLATAAWCPQANYNHCERGFFLK